MMVMVMMVMMMMMMMTMVAIFLMLHIPKQVLQQNISPSTIAHPRIVKEPLHLRHSQSVGMCFFAHAMVVFTYAIGPGPGE